MPSRRRHTDATSGATASSRAKPGSWARARSTNSRTASEAARSSALSASGGGSDRDATRYTRSPSTPSGSLEVARMRTRGQLRTTWEQNAAASSMTCSQLSSSRRAACSRSAAMSASGSGWPPWTWTPRTPATAARTCPASVTGARSTNQTPSAVPSSSSAAACRARRVLPQPPAPVRVTSRAGREELADLVQLAVPGRRTRSAGWAGCWAARGCRARPAAGSPTAASRPRAGRPARGGPGPSAGAGPGPAAGCRRAGSRTADRRWCRKRPPDRRERWPPAGPSG